MAYETTLLITKRFDFGGGNITIASVDLAATGSANDRVYSLLAHHRSNGEQVSGDVYITDERAITEDGNGNAMTIVPLDQLIDAMRKQNRKDKYRRFDVALAILTQFTGINASKWADYVIEVIQYGH